MESGSGPRAKRVTLADVAAVAGVSVKTVSHVMSGNPNVRLPQSTRDKVRMAADQVGYRANRFAQAIQSGRTDLIGVWINLGRPNINYLKFLEQISLRARESDHGLLVTGIDSNFAYSGTGESPKIWPMDGIIAVDGGKSIISFREDPRNDSIPVSVLGFEELKNSDSVAWELAMASKAVTTELISQGCTRIVHLTADWILRDYPREQRRRGYLEAMTESGLEVVILPANGETGAAGYEALTEYLQSNPVPNAITCFTDRLAMGAIKAVHAKGATVPDDCKIWGFGDYPEGQDWTIPISTMRIPTVEVITQSWNWLMDRIENPNLDPRSARYPVEIIKRASG